MTIRMTILHFQQHHSQLQGAVTVDEGLAVGLGTSSRQGQQEELDGPASLELVIVDVVPRQLEQDLG